MMLRRGGFTLIELLVYVLLLGFSAYVMISSNAVLAEWCAFVTARQQIKLQQTLLGDVMMRDIVAASHDVAYWSMDQGVFKKQFLNEKNIPIAYDVGYSCRDGQCMRMQGIFDYKGQQWLQCHRSVIAYLPLKEIKIRPVLGIFDQSPVVRQATVQLVGDNKNSIAPMTYRLRSGLVSYAR